MLLFVALGSAYLLVSVSVTLYRRRHAVPWGAQVGSPMTDLELAGCYEDLAETTRALQKHLEKFHHLLGGYDPDEAQRWADEGDVWRGNWKVLGQRCRFAEPRPPRSRKEFDEMVGVYDDLAQTEKVYTQELMRFGKHQAPRLDRIRRRMEQIRERLQAGSVAGDKR